MDYVVRVKDSTSSLTHYGIKGQVHGIRRFQNEDGSLTEAGKERYNRSNQMTKQIGGHDLPKPETHGPVGGHHAKDRFDMHERDHPSQLHPRSMDRKYEREIRNAKKKIGNITGTLARFLTDITIIGFAKKGKFLLNKLKS